MAQKLILDIEEIAHDEQLDVWAEELTFAIHEWLKEPDTYDDKVQLARAMKAEIKDIVSVVLDRVKDASVHLLKDS